MTVRTRAELISDAEDYLPDNTGGEISPADVRQRIIDLADSAVLPEDGGGGSGTVTSVAVTVPTGLQVSGSPITTSGTFAITYASGYQGYTTTEASKLSGIASGATANSSDATLLARANHTGTQLAATISDFSTAADARVSAAIGSTVQAYSANLTTWAGIAPSANVQSIAGAANYAAIRALLDLEAGTDFYSISAANAAFAAASHTHTVSALSDASANARSFLQAANYAAMKVLLSLAKADVGLGNVDNTSNATERAATATLTNKTLTDPAIDGCIKDEVFTISDAAGFQIDPSNGAIQFVTLGANRTPAATNFQDGESVTLRIDDGTARTITWSTVAVVWKGGSAPTLATSGYTEVNLEKSGGVIRGVHVGDFAS